MLKKIVVLVIALFAHANSYAVITYIPQSLRHCITAVYELARQTDKIPHLTELYSMVKENRIIASENLMRKGLEEAFVLLKRNKKVRSNKYGKSIKKYLKEYWNSLDDSCVLLAINGSDNQRISLPTSLVAKSLSRGGSDIDLMCLSSVVMDNISLSGYSGHDIVDSVTRAIKPNKLTDPGIIFNANMMTSISNGTPNVTFGTGVSGSIINAWAMPASNMIQSPINIQFPVPGDLKAKKAITLELHFLITQQSSSYGKARVRIQAEYIDQLEDFDLFDVTPNFSNTTDSDNFSITEPSSSNNVKHIVVTVPLENSDINKTDLALLSLTRIAPTSDSEYDSDIYLAAAIFRYSN